MRPKRRTPVVCRRTTEVLGYAQDDKVVCHSERRPFCGRSEEPPQFQEEIPGSFAALRMTKSFVILSGGCSAAEAKNLRSL